MLFWTFIFICGLLDFAHLPLPDSARDVRDKGSIPGLGRSPGVGNGKQFQNSCLENPKDRGAWRITVQGPQKVGHDWATEHIHKVKTYPIFMK